MAASGIDTHHSGKRQQGVPHLWTSIDSDLSSSLCKVKCAAGGLQILLFQGEVHTDCHVALPVHRRGQNASQFGVAHGYHLCSAALGLLVQSELVEALVKCAEALVDVASLGLLEGAGCLQRFRGGLRYEMCKHQ